MVFLSRCRAAAGIIGCFVLVGPFRAMGVSAGEATDDSLYETTGSIGGINRAILPLSEQQREHIHQGLMRFPDATRTGEQAPALADRVPREQPLQDLPANLTRKSRPCTAKVLEAERSDIGRRSDEPRGGGDDPALPPPPVALLALERPRGSHAPLQAGHLVIPARQLVARPCQIQRSVLTGSSACADDDDREDDN